MPSLQGKRSRVAGAAPPASKRSHLGPSPPLVDTRWEPALSILAEAGLVLSQDTDAPHHLQSHPTQVVAAVAKVFQNDFSHPEKVNQFQAAIQDLLSDGSRLQQGLWPCQSELAGFNPQQDSLVRLLLQLEAIQPWILPWLLEQLALIALEEEDQAPGLSLTQRAQRVNKPQLILAQISWLNRVVDPSGLADKVMEILDAVPVKAQFDVIAALPEVVDESHHGAVAMFLRDMMKSRAELSGPILEAFTNLSLDVEVMAEIQRSILKTLGSIRFEDLPVNVKFVLQSIEPGDELQVIRDLRESLDIVPPPVLTQATQRKKSNEAKDVSKMILDLIRNEFYGRRRLVDAWFRAIEAVKSAKELKTLDLMILVIIHNFPNRSKNVESLIKNKIRSSVLTEELMTRTLIHHKTGVKENFEDMMAIGEALSLTSEPSLNQFAVALYREMFLHLDRFCKQDLIADLVAKLSSGGSASLKRTSIKIISHLTFEHTVQLVPFSMFVFTILDHVVNLDLADVRPIMDILSFLAYSKGESSLQDNLQIVITKQISSTNLKIRRMGITSAVMTVKNMSNDPIVEESGVQDAGSSQITTTSANSSMVAMSTLRQAKDILENVCTSMKSAHDIGGLFMDELSIVIQGRKLHRKLEKWVSNTMTNDFEDEFVVDLAPDNLNEERNEFIPIRAMYNLEDQEDLAIALNLVPLLVQGSEINHEKGKSTAITRLIPHFRLLIKCTKAQKGNDLSDVDALLACPIFLPSRNVIDKFDSLSFLERNIVCAALFYGANWVREVLNAFSSQDGDESWKHRVLNRLKTLVAIEADLKNCLRLHPTFVPPTVLHLVDVSSWQPPNASSGRGKKTISGKGKGKGKKRKLEKVPNATLTQSVLNNTQKEAPNEGAGENAIVHLDHYMPFFREFDLDVFAILSFDTIDIASEGEWEQEIKDPKLRPSDLALLLNDLGGKLNHLLVSSKTKKGFPGKALLKDLCFSNLSIKTPKEVAQFAVNHLDYLLGNLESIAEYFKRLIDINDGVMDCANMFHDGTGVICDCFESLFGILKTLFSWNGFLGQDERPLLRDGLHIMARRINSKLKPSHPTSELASAAISYLAKFTDWILIIGTASAHTKLMDHLLQLTEEDSSRTLVAEKLEGYLKREWRNAKGDLEKGSAFNVHIESLLKIYLQCSGDPTHAMGAYFPDEFTKVVEGKGKEAVSDVFPTLNKSTFALHHRIFLESLSERVKSLIYGVNKNLEEHLEVWMVSSVQLFELLRMLKIQSNNRTILRFALKYSRILLDHFLKHGMPVVDKMFRRKRETSITLLKNMQQSTRLLQHACSHSKIFKDVSLAKHVPMLKKTLETFVYRVKSMLALNDAIDAFWMGTLKTRDLSGKEILSQSTNTSSTESENGEEEEEEEALPEEDQSDVELEEEENSSDRDETRDDDQGGGEYV